MICNQKKIAFSISYFFPHSRYQFLRYGWIEWYISCPITYEKLYLPHIYYIYVSYSQILFDISLNLILENFITNWISLWKMNGMYMNWKILNMKLRFEWGRDSEWVRGTQSVRKSAISIILFKNLNYFNRFKIQRETTRGQRDSLGDIGVKAQIWKKSFLIFRGLNLFPYKISNSKGFWIPLDSSWLYPALSLQQTFK